MADFVSEIKILASDRVPEGWLRCDGSAISRATYAELFDQIGTKWGVGDGSTTFNLPPAQGRSPAGVDPTDTTIDVVGKTVDVATAAGTSWGLFVVNFIICFKVWTTTAQSGQS